VSIVEPMEKVIAPAVAMASRMGGFDGRILEDVIEEIRALCIEHDAEDKLTVDLWLADQDYIEDLEMQIGDPTGEGSPIT